MKVRVWSKGEAFDFENAEEVEFISGNGYDMHQADGRLSIKPQEENDVSVQ